MSDPLQLKQLYCSAGFAARAFYPNLDLGVQCSAAGTVFKLWSPLAKAVTLLLYPDGGTSPAAREVPLEPAGRGVWACRFSQSLHGTYYLYRIDHSDGTVETGDPYATACGLNSQRCMVVDLTRTDPPGWQEDRAPARAAEDILYELHIKEFSWQEAGGFPEEARGRYKALTLTGTTLHSDGVHPTGLDYLKALGVTHVQLMPAFDYGSVQDDDPSQFNWGYDPLYYNIPEGSYSSDPARGEVRIRELKEAVQALHRQGLRVILDVVYNHTYDVDSPLNRVVPWYYYRLDEAGRPSNGSGCGSEIASELPMCAQFILQSVLYWAREYHIDGFRFDLMGLLDTALMNRIRRELDRIYGPGEKLLLGEPWAGGPAHPARPVPLADKSSLPRLSPGVAAFCDCTRDCIRGNVFCAEEPGFAAGAPGLEQQALRCTHAWYGDEGFPARGPAQVITYCSAHDNHTLWDRLGHNCPDPARRLRCCKLAAAFYMTCQGHLFLLSGEEFARTKDDQDNTYNASIELNQLDWEQAYRMTGLVDYYRGLIGLRKRCPGLCDKSTAAHLRFTASGYARGLVYYYLDNRGPGACCDTLCVVYNQSEQPVRLDLQPGAWAVLADASSSQLWQSPAAVLSGTARVPPVSAMILGQRLHR